MVKHPLPDEILMAYSAGGLTEAFSLVVAAHVSMSDDSRARLETFDLVGGALLEDGPSSALSDGSLEATLALIARDSDESRVVPKRPIGNDVLPAPLHDYIGGGLAAVRWRQVGMGVKQAILKSDGPETVRLLYIPTGVAVPDHSHGGTEMTLVLQGAYRDEIDAFERGDVEIADEDVHHQPVAYGSQDCICLAATDARLKFNSILPRLAQPFLRI